MSVNTKNVFQRLNAVMASGAEYLKKSKRVGTGNSAYNAVEYDALVAKIRGLFIQNGLVLVVKTNAVDPPIERKTSAGNPIYLTQGHFVVEVVNIDNPGDAVAISTYGYGLDNGDKGINKASTQAAKQALMKLLLVETGDDEESRAEDDGSSNAKAEATQTEGVGADVLDAIVSLVQKAATTEELEKLHKANYVKEDSELKAKGTRVEKSIYLDAVRAQKAKLGPLKDAA